MLCMILEATGGAGGTRTHGGRIMRTTVPCTVAASCTDDTENGTDGTHRAGIIPWAIPRTIPRPMHPCPVILLLCVTSPRVLATGARHLATVVEASLTAGLQKTLEPPTGRRTGCTDCRGTRGRPWLTYADHARSATVLRAARARAAHALAAPMSPIIALTVLAAVGISIVPFHGQGCCVSHPATALRHRALYPRERAWPL
jgi:hypothetical protein